MQGKIMFFEKSLNIHFIKWKSKQIFQLRSTTLALSVILLFIWSTYSPVWALYQDNEKTNKIIGTTDVVDIELLGDDNDILTSLNANLLPVPGIPGGEAGLEEITRRLNNVSSSAIETKLTDVILYKIVRVSNKSTEPVIVQMHELIPSVIGTKLGDHLNFSIAYMENSQLISATFNGSSFTNNVEVPTFALVDNPFKQLTNNEVSIPENGFIDLKGADKSRFLSLAPNKSFDVRLYAWLSDTATLQDVFLNYKPEITIPDKIPSQTGTYNFSLSFSAVPKSAVDLSIGENFGVWNK